MIRLLVKAGLMLMLAACTSHTPTYTAIQPSYQELGPAKARVVVYRPEAGLFLRDAPVEFDGELLGECGRNEFFIEDVTPGTHIFKTELWDHPGKCVIEVDLEEGQTYYFEVNHRERYGAFLMGGIVGMAVESHGKECGGAFSITQVPAQQAITKLGGLHLAD